MWISKSSLEVGRHIVGVGVKGPGNGVKKLVVVFLAGFLQQSVKDSVRVRSRTLSTACAQSSLFNGSSSSGDPACRLLFFAVCLAAFVFLFFQEIEIGFQDL